MRLSLDLAFLSGFLLLAAACGSSSSPSSSGSNDGSAKSSSDAGPDSAGGGGQDVFAADDASDASVALDAPGTDGSVDAAADHALDAPSGADAASEASVDAQADAPADAPLDSSCAGSNLQTDPHNCGTCGVTCSTSGACSVGHCTDVLIASGSVNAISGYAKGIRVDGSGIYVTSANAACVFSIPLGGGTPNPIIAPALTGITGSDHLAISGASLYWTTGGGHSVYSVSTAGGAATPISTSENAPDAIVTDGTNVYWTDISRIRYSPLGSASPTTLPIATTGGTSPSVIVSDATSVYWLDQYVVRKMAKTGDVATLETLASYTATLATALPNGGTFNDLTLDGTYVYFTQSANGAVFAVYRTPKG